MDSQTQENQEIEEKTILLKEIQRREEPRDGVIIRQLDKEFANLLELEDIKWKQHAKRIWYGLEDQNTRYFYACVTHRKRKNRIHYVLNEDNVLVSSPSYIEEVIIGYCQELFTSSNPFSIDLEDCQKSVEKIITSKMNNDLTKQFTQVEIQEALHQMALLKSPSLDGFNAGFYQTYWQVIIGDDVKIQQ